MTDFERPRIAILASGGGTTAEAYFDAIAQGLVDAEVGLVVTNNPDAAVLQRVAKANALFGFDIKTAIINGRTHPEGNLGRGQTVEESMAIADLVDSFGIELVALMGYMKQVNGPLLERYGWKPDSSIFTSRMLNTHPAPIPETADTFGINASRKVLELGLKESKHTVHVVSAGIDKGPIFAAHTVPVLPRDTPETLFARLQKVEKERLPYDIDAFVRTKRLFDAETREDTAA
jgi:phosphoribosylglycinamide formyltransferase-1